MEAIKRVSLSEQVVRSIIEYIRTEGLQPGSKLPTESDFAELLQVSRSSIREAMKALSINGAIVSIPGRGTFLQPKAASMILTRDGILEIEAETTIAEIMEVRTALEVTAAELAIQRGTDEEIVALGEANEELKKAILEGGAWAAPGSLFHAQIAEMSGNSLLVSTIQSLAGTIGKYKDAMTENGTKMLMYVDNHRAIYEAIRDRDPVAARIAVVRHMAETENDLKKLVDKNTAMRFIYRD